MAVGIYAQAIIYDHKRKQYFLICQEEKRLELTLFIEKMINKKLSKRTEQESFVLASNWQSNMDKASYIEKFNQVQQFLSSGDCYQINLSQRFSANYQGSEFQAYIALRSENKAPFSAFIRLENTAILSVSPERFLQLSQGRVQSKPIKGTMPRSSNKQQDEKNAQQLANSVKDRAENVMIVDLLRNDISKVCKANSVVVPKLFDIESFPAVHHLVSTVEGQLAEQYNACDLLRGAFPGGSITGAPKIRAMEIIEQLEPHRRSIYCGSVGYISNCGTMDTSITIRTLICQKSEEESSQGKIYCSAGGGLVADSIATSEYQETFDKVNRILPVLAKFTAAQAIKLNRNNNREHNE
jgi:para-aminobenzoate synthetase component 1